MKTGLKLKNDLMEMERLLDCVLAFGKEHALSDDFVWEIRLVLEEVETHIIIYGHEDMADHALLWKI
jgi:anti-sigma regulatory factor (Ser/Thr protein kinase)